MKLKELKERFDIREILKFLVGGGSAVLVDLVTYRLFVFGGLDVDISKLISYVLGAAVGFVINKLWTFKSKRFRLSEIIKYIILYAFSALANTLVNTLVLKIFDIMLLAFLAATGTSTVINFLGQKFFVFSKKDNSEE